jgi:hypothetical protein
MLHKVASALLVLCLLTSCGGGGGGGGSSSSGGSNGGVRFTPDRSSVDLAYDEGASFMPTTNITVTASGTFSGTLYIGAVVEGNGIDANIPASISGQTAVFTLQARSGLAAGTYSGRVQLLGCKDADCKNQIGNSPVIINYTLTVRVTLAVTPGAVTATAQSGSATTSNVTVRLPTGATSFTTAFNSGEQWMTIDQVTATGFRVNLRSMPQGNFNGSIRVSAGTSQVSIPVDYTVTGGVPYAPMNVQPNNLTLTGSEGAVNAPVTLTVTPPSWDPATSLRLVQPQSNDPVTWLSSAPVNGGYALTVNAANLTAGTYNAWALVTGAFPSQEIQVPIALTIGIGLVLPADQVKIINAESTAANLTGTVPVNVVAGPSVNWTAQSFAPWLILTDATGVTGETLAFRIDPNQLNALPNDGTEVWGSITITPQRANMSPRTFAVRVSKRLAAVTHVGPYLQPTGRNTRLILRGYGFDAIDNLTARLQFGGGTVSQITRVNDTELVVNTGPLNLGIFPFSFTNALNVSTATASVHTFTPQNFAAAALPTGGNLAGLFYDAERSSVYLVNENLESLQRYRFTNQWNLSSLPVPAIVGAGLSQDGSRLLLATSTASASRIRQLDPADMNLQISSTDLTQTLYTSWSNAITSTNDGRAWFAVGSGWNDMAYFDPVTGELTIVRPPINTYFYGGPAFALSRDGERLMILQTGSNAQDMLYMDAADSVVRTNPANLQNNYRMSFSDDAERYLYDNYEVRDHDFALIGRLPGQLPQASGDIPHWIFSSVLSPDGSRVYAVALPTDFPYQTTPARLYIFDSSTRQQASDELPLLGYMNIAGYPTCAPLPPNTSCNYGAKITVSPDGNTVFVAGDSNLVVVPVANPILTPVMKARPSATQKVGRGATVPWHLNMQ